MNIKPTLFDNYYWQHQNQLQPSALTFQALVQDKKAPAAATSEAAETSEPRPFDKATLSTTLVITIKSQMPAEIMLRHFDVDALINGVNKQINAQAILPQLGVAQSVINQTKTITQSGTVTSPAFVSFKNPHVFIDEHCIELTLNTRALSLQEANALQRTIKQWLVQNGYALKTLIINGVQQ